MDDAQRAFDALREGGFSQEEISFVANKNVSESWGGSDTRTDKGETASDIAADAGIGAALGGVGGLLLSFAGLAIPGIGPVLAAGPILAALGGAGIGAAAGGLIGALIESGIPHEHAEHYAESVRRGDILITVRADEARTDRAAEILDENGAVDIDRRVSEWRVRGWESYNPSAEPLSTDELKRERDYFRAACEQENEWTEQARRNTGTGSGLGTGPGTLGDQGQQRGTAPTASSHGGSLPGAEAQNADRDADRSSAALRQQEREKKREADFHQDTVEDIADRRSGSNRRAARIYDHTTK
jgi:hypothetical protein